MSLTKSQQETIGSIYKGNKFIIPTYQRKYSWRTSERKALWDDIVESKSENMDHFIGTLCFEEQKSIGLSTDTIYEVIDGQQRLTTMYLLLNSLIKKLPDSEVKDGLIQNFIGISKLKLVPLGEDNDFFNQCVLNFHTITKSSIKTRSKRRIYQSIEEFDSLVNGLSDDEIEEFIIYVRDRVKILIFNVEDQSQAIRMFSIINDRGLPLSILDKTKSTLMLYSTLKLQNALNDKINKTFENIFNSIDEIMDLKEELNILGRLDENTLYTHHYYSSRHLFTDVWNNRDGSESIFDNIKIKCEKLKKNDQELQKFIETYISDLEQFCSNYRNLIADIKIKPKYQKPFMFLEFTATLYPLIVRLYGLNKLDRFLTILESLEVRVYKLKGTNPIADAFYLSSEISPTGIDVWGDDDIENHLKWMNEKFMNSFNFKNYLDADVYRNNAVKYILMEFNKEQLTVEQYRNLQIEHLFSQDPNYNPEDYGFTDDYDYEIDRIGNLLLLESKKNQSIKNVAPKNKINTYLQSHIKETRDVAGKMNNDEIDKSFIDTRKDEIVNFCLDRFKL